MNKQTSDTLALLAAVRKNIAGICKAVSLEQLNKIPAGFNNNLIWNAGHVVATMELLTYALSGLPTPSDKDFINSYRKGTRPEGEVDQAEADRIIALLKSSNIQLGEDIQQLDFSNYKTYETSFGVTLTSIDDALAFNNMHEAMHLGTMLALKKLV